MEPRPSRARTGHPVYFALARLGQGSAGDVEVDAVNAAAGGDVQRFAVLAGPGDVRGLFGNENGPQRLAVGREDPYAAGASAVDVALLVHFHAVRRPGTLVGRRIVEELRLSQCAVRLHP